MYYQQDAASANHLFGGNGSGRSFVSSKWLIFITPVMGGHHAIKQGKEIMTQNIIAVYEHGILRPLEPLRLPENQKVRIRVDIEKQMDSVETVFQFLIDIGWLTPPSGQSKIRPIPLEERNRAADILGQAAIKPVSEMIIEDRGDRSAAPIRPGSGDDR